MKVKLKNDCPVHNIAAGTEFIVDSHDDGFYTDHAFYGGYIITRDNRKIYTSFDQSKCIVTDWSEEKKEKTMTKPIEIEKVRKASKKTPLSELIADFNEQISEAADKYKSSVEIDVGDDVEYSEESKKSSGFNSHHCSGEKAYKMLPQLHQDAVKEFKSMGYTTKFKYSDRYIDEPYSERWEKKFIITISW